MIVRLFFFCQIGCLLVKVERYVDDVCLYVGHVCGKLGLHNWSICVSCLVGL